MATKRQTYTPDTAPWHRDREASRKKRQRVMVLVDGRRRTFVWREVA